MRQTLLAVALLASASAAAQTYVVSSTTQPYSPLTGATPVTLVAKGSFTSHDEGYFDLPLGFSFPYYGNTYTQVHLDTNGVLVFGTQASNCTTSVSCTGGGPMPSSTRTPHNVIAPWWRDMDGSSSTAAIRYTQTSSEVVIEYANWGYYAYSGTYSYKVRLNASGLIQVHYGPQVGASTTVSGIMTGFENDTGSAGAPLLSCASTTSGCTSTAWPTDTLFTIGQPVNPLLVVNSVTLANMSQNTTTLSFTVNATLGNFGQNPANNFYWKAYLSTDKVLNTSGTSPDTLVYTSTTPVTVAGLGSLQVSANVSTPKPPAGQYYVLVEADSSHVVNPAPSPVGSTANYFTQGIDLVATSVSGPALSGPGNALAVNVKYFNQGTDAPTAPVPWRIILSNASQQFELASGTKTMTGGQSIDENVNITVPVGVPGGDFNYVLQIDNANVIAEASETNNAVTSTAKVTMLQADLVAEQGSADWVDVATGASTRVGYFGQQGRLAVSVKNAGGADAKNFKIGVVISTDANLSLLSDTLIYEQAVSSVPASTTQVVGMSFPIPLKDGAGKDFATSQYYIFVLLDSGTVVTELSKQNNVTVVSGPVTLKAPAPDYAVVSVEAPATAAVGELMPVTRTIRNVGNVDGGKVKYQYFASANDIVTTEDVPLLIYAGGTTAATGEVQLAVTGEDKATEVVRLPATMSAGTYYVGCIVDVDQTEGELDELNNAHPSNTTVQVAPAALRIATTQVPDGLVGRSYTFQLVAVGAQAALTWSTDVAAGSLPEGMTLSAGGLLSGTPTASGVSAFTVLASDGVHLAAGRLVLRVVPGSSQLQVTSTALPPIVNVVGLAYNASLAASGGTRPYTWRLVSGSLPDGLSLATDGTISGSLRKVAPLGETRDVFEVADSLGNRAQAEIRVKVVEQGTVYIKTLAIPDSLVNTDYLTDLIAANTDGSALAKPLVWSVAVGTLPDGLTLSTQGDELGILQGKPLVAGTYGITLQVEDAKGRADVQDFILRVFPNRFKLAFVNAPATLHPGDQVSFPITSGTTTGVHYSMYSGVLPPGLALADDGIISGTITDDDTAPGVYNFVVQARDDDGGSGLGAFTLEVTPAPRKVGCSSAPGGTVVSMGVLVGLGLLLGRRRRAAGLAVVASVCISGAALAQTPITYQMVGPKALTYVPLVGGTNLTQVARYTGEAVALPFPINFYGTTFSSVTVSMHGYIVFSGDGTEYSNYGIPHSYSQTYYPLIYIAGWWDYLDCGGTTYPYTCTGTSAIRTGVVGTAPTREFVVEYSNVAVSGATSTKFGFQIRLQEGTNRVRLAYGPNAPGTVSTASVGIQNGASVGMAALACTTATSGTCSAANWPANTSIDFFLPPDLVVAGLGGDVTGYAGVPYHSTATISNIGGREVNNVKVRFFLSVDSALDPADLPLGDSMPVDVATYEQVSVMAAGPIPSGTAPGDYYLLAKVDPDNAVVEQSKSNNVSQPIAIKVGPPMPDLVVSALSGPTQATPGQTLSIQRVISNVGNAATTATAKYTYLLSSIPVATMSGRVLPPVGTAPALAPSVSDTQTDQITLPNDLLAGQYWIGACVDYDGTATATPSAISEISEVNNCTVTSAGFLLNTGNLTIVTTSLPGAAQYSPYGQHLVATGGDGSYQWTLSGGQLPSGIVLGPDGYLSGAPGSTGAFSFQAKVTSGGDEKSVSLSLSVIPSNIPLAIVDQELPTAEFGRSYQASLVAVGGKPPYVWTLDTQSRLPVGVALSADGLVVGRATEAGDFPFRVQIADSVGTQAAKDLRVRVVNPVSMHIATSRLEVGFLKKDYLQRLQAVGGKSPYDWSVVKFQKLAENPTDAPGKPEAALPANFGLKIEQDGTGMQVLRGVPTQAGLFALTLRAQDAAGNEELTTLPLSISYEQGLTVTTSALPDAFVGHPYTVKLSHNGGDTAVNIQFSVPCVKQAQPNLEDFGCAPTDPSQNLPGGLFMGSDGLITGTPTPPVGAALGADGLAVPVVYSFLVKVVDGSGREDVRGLSIKVRPDYDAVKPGCGCSAVDPLSVAALASAALVWARRRRRSFPGKRVGSGGLSVVAVVALTALGALSCGGSKNICVDKNVRCEAPLACDPEDGVCKCGGRGGVLCAEGYVCDPLANTCLSTRCSQVTCSGGYACDGTDGVCKCGGTGGKVCPTGEYCKPETKECLPVLDCRQVACPRNQTCDQVTGHCKCGPAECSAGMFCSLAADSTKTCVENLCSGVVCSGANACDPSDGYCKCNGSFCQNGQACLCPAGADGGCLSSDRSCKTSTACTNVTCAIGTSCDPMDGQCKCAGPGGPVCSSVQICALGPPPACQGGQQCTLPDGGAKLCAGGTSCDPEDGACKCGGRGGQLCKAATAIDPADICVSSPTQQACKRPCDPRSADCPAGSFCYFDPTSATPAAYCSVPTDVRVDGQSCMTATACFVQNPPTALHCNGLAVGTTGICRAYCDVASGSAACVQVPKPQICVQISGAPTGYGYCQPQ